MNESVDRRKTPRGKLSIAGDALYGVFRFIARHVRGFYAAVITYLSFSFIIALGALWGFAMMADTVVEGGTQRVDESILTWVEANRSDVLNAVALDITALGNTATLVVLVLCVSAFLWLTRHKLSVALLMVALAGGAVLNMLLKNLFDRPRPSVVAWETDVTSLSFPSGHAMSAMVAYATVAFLVGRLEPTRALRWTTWGFAALIIFAVGASRIYLGVHYPSDVIAGFIAGLAWVALAVSGMRAIQYFASRKPEVEEEEKDLHAEEEREAGLRA